MKILLYGYYFNCNFGDNIFEYIFSKILDNYNIDYIKCNPSSIYDIEGLDINLILIGGGEIINDYFLIPLFRFIKKKNYEKIPIIGISIGTNETENIYNDFFDAAIFRNNISLVNNFNYFHLNDIVFSINQFIEYKSAPELNTIGLYLIPEMNENKIFLLINFINLIKFKYKINFLIFDIKTDFDFVYNLIKKTNLTNYTVKYCSNIDETINEMLKNQYHLCMRFHSHVICYLFKQNFISFPLTSKTIQFDNDFNIPICTDESSMVNNLNQQINFQNINYDLSFILKLINATLEKKDFLNKKDSIWFKLVELYDEFINEDNMEKITNDIIQRLDINQIYNYGLLEQMKVMKANKNYSLQHFTKIITNIYKK